MPHRLRGISLTDLMVGLAIGLLVAVLALHAFSSARLTASSLEDSMRLQQRADDIFHNLGVQILQAGAIDLTDDGGGNGGVTFSTAFSGLSPAVPQANGRILSIHGAEGSSQPLAHSDVLRTSHQNNDRRPNCLGQLPTRGAQTDNEYWADNGVLHCKSTEGFRTPGAQAIAEGVEQFDVRYGVKTRTATGAQFAFHAADHVPDWSNIQAVRVCLLLASDTGNHPPPAAPRDDCSGAKLAQDGSMRRVFQRTFSLRNALP